MLNLKISIPALLSTFFFFQACKNNKNTSDGYGNFEADEVTISAQATGELNRFNITEGQRIDSGELVGYIDTTQLSLRIRQLEANRSSVATKPANVQSQVNVLQQQYENLLKDKARIEKMLKDGAATRKQLDDINGAIEVVDRQRHSAKTQGSSIPSELKSIEAQISQLKDQVKKSAVVNPLKGTILEKYANQFEVTSIGKPLYKIANLDSMYLRVFISEEQLTHVHIGQQVTVLVDEDKEKNRSFVGRISWVSQEAEFTPKTIQTKDERVTQVYAIKVRVRNDGTLKIGMPGEIKL